MKKILYVSTVILVMFYLSNCNVSTANISDVKMCETIDGNQCNTDNSVFTHESPAFYCTCVVNNAPDGTKLTFSWYYLGDEKTLIDAVSVEVPGGSSTYTMQSNLSAPDAGWPAGKYEVVLDLGTDNSQPVTKSFEVK
ncbi:MAG: hypothetical protein P1P88_25330 [Bacteroidales bacterium]|nr:hypothetical protein [Bacteroidales bacterium]